MTVERYTSLEFAFHAAGLDEEDLRAWLKLDATRALTTAVLAECERLTEELRSVALASSDPACREVAARIDALRTMIEER